MEPINIAIPNTSKRKMAAIVALSEAIKNVSEALISTQVEITCSNNKFSGVGTSISINLEEDKINNQEDEFDTD